MSTVCIFEDERYRKLLPLVYTRPVYDLRCGMTTLREKIIRQYRSFTISLHTRDYLVDVLRQNNSGFLINTVEEDTCLFINGRVLAEGDLAKKIPAEGEDCLFVSGDQVVAARLSGSALAAVKQALNGPLSQSVFQAAKTEKVDVKLINFSWDLVHHNGKQIENDFKEFAGEGAIQGKVYDGATLVNPSQIFIGKGSKVKPGAVLDAEGGSIYIGENVTIFPNAVIEGPAFIGDESKIKIGAKIYEGTSIGEVCKVGGEVEESIIHSYSNKQHDGFLGHAYLGQWVNLGADTNNSDLKNNYGNVRVYVDGEMIDSGSMFVGLTMGDHSKSGINSMFNTATVVGVACNMYGAGLPPKYVPSFSWGGSDAGFVEYDPKKALEVAKVVLGRRKIEFTKADEALLTKVYEMTKEERRQAGIQPAPKKAKTKEVVPA